jgi:ferritin
MINKKLEVALNEQINAEFYSAYLYLSMSAYLDTINFAGFANWMLVQFQEEQFHAKKMFD